MKGELNIMHGSKKTCIATSKQKGPSAFETFCAVSTAILADELLIAFAMIFCLLSPNFLFIDKIPVRKPLPTALLSF